MKNNFKIIVGFFVLIIAIVLIVIYSTKDPQATPPVTNASSALGCYVAHLQKDIYILIIEKDVGGIVSGKVAYNNFQKDSSSGSFTGTFKDGILLGNYSFESEGSHSDRQLIFKKVGENFIQGFGLAHTVSGKEEFIDIPNITFDDNSTFIKSKNCTEQFTDSNYIFTFNYNSFFKAYEGQNILTTNWRQNSKTKGILLASVSTFKPFMPQTNFSDVRWTVGRSIDTKDIKSCNTSGTGETREGEKIIDGYVFNKFLSSDAGAGNFYETTSYRGIVNGECYAIEYNIHSTNIANYPSDQNIKEFDKTKIINEMEKIITSFEFFINSD